jgi:hypothetical protein
MPSLTGESAATNQAGVQGTNTVETGVGVWGQCDKGRGVVGVSRTGTGVWADTDTERAVVGVVELPGEGVGVWGHTKSGRGVVGVVDDPHQGIGVFGKGGRRAGVFEGDVDITGNLTIQGVSIQDWLGRIVRLEQEVASLKQQVAARQHGTGTTHPPGTHPVAAQLHLRLVNHAADFSIAAVQWNIFRQTLGSITPVASVNGVSADVPIPANGQYLVRADVTVNRSAAGTQEVAEFRGDGSVFGRPALIFVWTGSDQVKNFLLIEENQGGFINPVVILGS